MTSLATLRRHWPGRWLGVALVADLLSYTTVDHGPGAGTLWWVALDLWLAYRVWRHGSTALAVFRGFQLFGLIAFGVVVALSPWQDNLATDATLATVGLYAVSVWALMAPALSGHVTATRRPRGAPEDSVAVH